MYTFSDINCGNLPDKLQQIRHVHKIEILMEKSSKQQPKINIIIQIFVYCA